MKSFTKIADSERGASMVEYGLIVAVISMMTLSAVTLLGDNTEDSFETVAEAMDVGQNSDGSSVSSSAQDESSGDSDQNSGDAGGSAADDSQDDAGHDDFQDESQSEADEQSSDHEADDEQAASDDNGSSDEPNASGEEESEDSDSDQGDSPEEGEDDSVGGAGSDDESAAGSKGSQANPTTTASSFTWWNDNKHGGQGEWKASVTFENDWIRHQYLTLQVTTVDHEGKTKTIEVDSFYVPANGATTFHHWGNFMKDHKGEVTGVMEVHVEVVDVTTSDEDWKPVSFPQVNGPTSVVKAPPSP